jgi:hypothetical protein
VRAALAISALLFAVVVVAVLFNVFSGDGTASSTTLSASSSTSPTSQELAPIEPISVDCDPPGIGSFVCDNLISGSDAEYQVTFEDLAESANVVIRITFRQPMTVTGIEWTNLEDPTRFKQNYRAHGIVINAQDSLTTVPKQLEDTPGPQSIAFASVDTTWVELTIESAYTAEVTDGNVFRELAIQEITVIGRPSTTEE